MGLIEWSTINIKYKSGEEVQLGDHETIKHGETLWVVSAIIESKIQLKQFRVDEAEAVISLNPVSLVF